MIRKHNTLRQKLASHVVAFFRHASDFFWKLRNVDVDSVGKAAFQHCSSPKALYVTLFERWWIVGVCAFLGACFGLYNISKAISKYETHGSILVYQKMPTFLDSSVSIPDPKAYDALFATHVALIASQKVVDAAIEQYELEKHCPEIIHEIELKEAEGEHATFSSYVRSHLKVARAGSGDSAGAFVIMVGFGHTSEEECPIVVNAILDTYRGFVNKSLLFDTDGAVQLVLKAKDRMEAEMQAKGDAYREFLKSAPGVWNRMTENNPHQARIDAFKTELTALEMRRVAVASRLTILQQTHNAKTGEPLTDLERMTFIDQGHVARLQMLVAINSKRAESDANRAYPELQEIESARYDKLLVMYGERAKVMENLGPDHPRVRDLEVNIRSLESELKRMQPEVEYEEPSPKELLAAYQQLLEKDLSDLETRIHFVNQQIDQEIAASKQLTDFTVKAKQLEDEYERSLETYNTIIAKATRQNVLEEFGSFIAEIMSRPVHCEMTWPKKPVILALCTILGIFFGSFLALALDLIAYTPLRSVFPFLPRWLLGGPTEEPIDGVIT